MQKIWVFIKKWWMLVAVACLGLFILAYAVLKGAFKPSVAGQDTEFLKQLSKIKDKLQEVSTKAQVEARAVETKDQALRQELKDVVAIESRSERLKRLAELAKR